jgi:hypothetical protein
LSGEEITMGISLSMVMNVVQVTSLLMQLVQIVPDLGRIVGFYFETCKKLRQFVAGTGESGMLEKKQLKQR